MTEFWRTFFKLSSRMLAVHRHKRRTFHWPHSCTNIYLTKVRLTEFLLSQFAKLRILMRIFFKCALS